MKRGDKIFLDSENKIESTINTYLDCRDGVVELYEYNDMSGYGNKTRLFLCQNTKHESTSIIRQVFIGLRWYEEEMNFDSDSFVFLKALLNGKKGELGGQYKLLRDYFDSSADNTTL